MTLMAHRLSEQHNQKILALGCGLGKTDITGECFLVFCRAALKVGKSFVTCRPNRKLEIDSPCNSLKESFPH
jgi:hypothetical protein